MSRFILHSDTKIVVAAILGVSISSIVLEQLYELWKSSCAKRANHRARRLCRDGMLVIRSAVSGERKRSCWENILRPHMVSHWKKQYENFSLQNINDIPQPQNGRRYEMTSTHLLDGMPLLVSENFELQMIIAALIDKRLALVSFGSQTHWKLKLFMSPLWFMFGDKFQPTSMIQLSGADQAWHLTNAPNVHAKVGCGIPSNTHFDGGVDNIFMTNGVPLGSRPASIEDRLLMTAFHQIAIMFHCETPGVLGKEEVSNICFIFA